MMLIGHSMPAVTAITFSSTLSGGGFLGATEGGLVDGFPARVARLAWPTTAGGISDSITIQLQFAEATKIRLVGLLGVDLPPGTEIAARLLAGATENAAFGEVLRRLPPAGASGAWIVFPQSIADSDRLQIIVSNNLDGSPAIAANQIIEIGEVVAMQAEAVPLSDGWKIDTVDPSADRFSRDSQPIISTADPYRLFEGTLAPSSFDQVYNGGLEFGGDLTRLQAALAGDQRCVAIARWRGATGLVDTQRVVQLAVYGRGRMTTGAVHGGGDYYEATLTVQEAPANPP